LGATTRVSDEAHADRQLADAGPLADLPIAVAAGARFEGLLSFRGGSCVDGEFRGQIAAKGRLVVGEAAHVRGSVEADEVVIAGVLEGEVKARGRLELLSTARLIGDFSSPCVIAREGCEITGQCRTDRRGPASKQSPSSS
jgi:cytoskeletal protein CcmA (bactofilin family)